MINNTTKGHEELGQAHRPGCRLENGSSHAHQYGRPANYNKNKDAATTATPRTFPLRPRPTAAAGWPAAGERGRGARGRRRSPRLARHRRCRLGQTGSRR